MPQQVKPVKLKKGIKIEKTRGRKSGTAPRVVADVERDPDMQVPIRCKVEHGRLERGIHVTRSWWLEIEPTTGLPAGYRLVEGGK